MHANVIAPSHDVEDGAPGKKAKGPVAQIPDNNDAPPEPRMALLGGPSRGSSPWHATRNPSKCFVDTLGGDRFYEEIDCPEAEGCGRRSVVCAHEDEGWRTRQRMQHLGEFEPVKPGHSDVKEDDIEGAAG